MKDSAAPAKTNHTALLIIGASVSILLLVAMVLAYSARVATDERQVKYIVSGSGSVESASITYNNEQGEREQLDANLPWEKELKVSSGAILSIVAQTSGSRADTITCEIWLNNQPRQSTTSVAEYGLVTCTDLAP